jgi:hypothetical protein
VSSLGLASAQTINATFPLQDPIPVQYVPQGLLPQGYAESFPGARYGYARVTQGGTLVAIPLPLGPEPGAVSGLPVVLELPHQGACRTPATTNTPMSLGKWSNQMPGNPHGMSSLQCIPLAACASELLNSQSQGALSCSSSIPSNVSEHFGGMYPFILQKFKVTPLDIIKASLLISNCILRSQMIPMAMICKS